MKWLFVLAVVPYYLALLIACLIWLTVLHPIAFTTKCSVTNKTSATLTITPVGTVGPEGQRTPLTLYRTSFPFFIKLKHGDFEIEPEETFRFDYDMDDINFSEIVVKNSTGEMRQIVSNPNPTENHYVAPEITDFEIDDFDTLPPVPVNVEAVAASVEQTRPMWMVYAVSALLLAAEFCRLQFFGAKKIKSEPVKLGDGEDQD